MTPQVIETSTSRQRLGYGSLDALDSLGGFLFPLQSP